MKHSLPPPGGDLSFENIFLNTFGVFIGRYVNMAPCIFTFFNILWPRLRAMSCWSFYLQYLGDVCHEQMLSGWSLHEGSLLIRCGMRKKVVSRWRVELNQENEKWLIFAIKRRNVISWTPKNTIKMEARHLRSVIVNLKIRRTLQAVLTTVVGTDGVRSTYGMELACCSVFSAWDHALQRPTQRRGNIKLEERTWPLTVDLSLWDQDPHRIRFWNWCLSVDPTGRKGIVY